MDALHLIGRTSALFTEDVNAAEPLITEMISQSSFLIIGGQDLSVRL